jgi:NADH-quinone oxidoreductase subunit N
MAAFRKSDVKGNEGGIKFFIIGVLSTAVMLYGMSMIIGLTGSTSLTGVAEGLGTLSGGQQTLADASILFVIVGFAFKVSAVPFQFWAPDTYEGAPVPVAAFLGAASNVAGFVGLLQLMFVAFAGEYEFWVPMFAALSILTMTVGNLVALQQRQVVRLLAYSGIAQAGYILLPFALVSADTATNEAAFSAAVSYIVIYAIMNLGAFAVAAAVSRRHPRLLISELSGLVKVAPVLAVGMTVFMVSLAGVPPTGGFWGKFLIFQAAIERGGLGTWLAAIMVVNSVISVVYYFAIPRAMIFQEAETEEAIRPSWLVTAVVAAAMVALVAIFVLPNPIANLGDIAVFGG